MKAEHSTYHAYLLRLWQTRLDGKAVWRALLECPHTGERQGFTDLQALFAYLAETVGHDNDNVSSIDTDPWSDDRNSTLSN